MSMVPQSGQVSNNGIGQEMPEVRQIDLGALEGARKDGLAGKTPKGSGVDEHSGAAKAVMGGGTMGFAFGEMLGASASAEKRDGFGNKMSYFEQLGAGKKPKKNNNPFAAGTVTGKKEKVDIMRMGAPAKKPPSPNELFAPHTWHVRARELGYGALIDAIGLTYKLESAPPAEKVADDLVKGKPSGNIAHSMGAEAVITAGKGMGDNATEKLEKQLLSAAEIEKLEEQRREAAADPTASMGPASKKEYLRQQALLEEEARAALQKPPAPAPIAFTPPPGPSPRA